MKKIYFYSPRAEGGKAVERHLYINTAPLYLTSYLRRHRPDLLQQISWERIQLLKLDKNVLVEQLRTLDIDILCLSIYMWNIDCLETIRGVKQALGKNLTVVVGGPSVEIMRNRRFLHDHADVDFAVYAQGEPAFVGVLDHVIGEQKLNVLDAKNLAWLQEGDLRMGQFEYIKMGETSPFLENRDLLQKIVDDPEYRNHAFILPYETSKGCAYNCSFCDWTSGMSHMTSHRKFDIESELDMLGQLGLTNFHPSDANFGEHRQDIEIARTMARLKKQKGYPFYIRDTNLSKMKKKEAFQILEILLEAGILQKPKFAVQDTHLEILQNVDRPDVPWKEHEKLIRDLQIRYPDISCEVELIKGLPGQTRESWEESLIEMQGLTAVIYYWLLLPNSPAGHDLAWRERYQIQTMFMPAPATQKYKNEVVVGSMSYDFRDYAYFTLLGNLLKHKFIADITDRRGLFDRVRSSKYLEQTLDDICEDLRDEKSSDGRVATARFIKDLFREYRDWDKDTVKRMLNFTLKKDPGEMYDWWKGAKEPTMAQG